MIRQSKHNALAPPPDDYIYVFISTFTDEHTFAKHNLTTETHTYKHIWGEKKLSVITQSDFAGSFCGSQFFSIYNSARVL